MSKPVSNIQTHTWHDRPSMAPAIRLVSVKSLGMSLGLLFSVTFVLCVLFDLWFPALAMNQVWAPLLPGFTWISWTSFLVGLTETFAYGWYIALIFGPLYNFFASRSDAGKRS